MDLKPRAEFARVLDLHGVVLAALHIIGTQQLSFHRHEILMVDIDRVVETLDERKIR